MDHGEDVASLREGQAEIRAVIRSLEERVDQLEHTLRGNGRPGLVDTVTTIATGIAVLKWMWVSTVIPFSAALIYEIVRR